MPRRFDYQKTLAERLGGSLELVDPSPAVTELLELAGLADFFTAAAAQEVAA